MVSTLSVVFAGLFRVEGQFFFSGHGHYYYVCDNDLLKDSSHGYCSNKEAPALKNDGLQEETYEH
jgi:hypothetical protein